MYSTGQSITLRDRLPVNFIGGCIWNWPKRGDAGLAGFLYWDTGGNCQSILSRDCEIFGGFTDSANRQISCNYCK